MRNGCSYDPYRLGMCEWTNCLRALLNSPRLSLTLQTTRTAPPSASKLHPNTSNLLKKRSFHKGLVPENTNKSTKWALNNFEAWMKARNTSYADDQVPQDILLCSDPELLNLQNLHLSRFVIETRNSNGEFFIFFIMCSYVY